MKYQDYKQNDQNPYGRSFAYALDDKFVDIIPNNHGVVMLSESETSSIWKNEIYLATLETVSTRELK